MWSPYYVEFKPWVLRLGILVTRRQRYARLAGYVGIVWTFKGVAVKVLRSHHDAAMLELDRPPGDTYELLGMPISSALSDRKAGWHVIDSYGP
eukprot:1384723-Amphidinium_carterae.1